MKLALYFDPHATTTFQPFLLQLPAQSHYMAEFMANSCLLQVQAWFLSGHKEQAGKEASVLAPPSV